MCYYHTYTCTGIYINRTGIYINHFKFVLFRYFVPGAQTWAIKLRQVRDKCKIILILTSLQIYTPSRVIFGEIQGSIIHQESGTRDNQSKHTQHKVLINAGNNKKEIFIKKYLSNDVADSVRMLLDIENDSSVTRALAIEVSLGL